MKNVLAVYMLLFLGGCAGGQTWGAVMPNRAYHFPPTDAPVELYERAPDKDYDVIGEVHAHADPHSSKEDLMQELKEQAATIVADAVINIVSTEGRFEFFAKGTAVKWK